MIENHPKYPVELIYIPDFGMIRERASDSNKARGAAADYMGRGAVSDINMPRGFASESNSLDLAKNSDNCDLTFKTDLGHIPERRQPYVYDDSVIFQNGAEYDSKSGHGSGFAHDNFIYDIDIVRGDSIDP